MKPLAFADTRLRIPMNELDAYEQEHSDPTPEQARIARLRALGVPARYDAVSDDLQLPQRAEGWTGDPWALTILGPAGTGKTWIAVSLLSRLWAAKAMDGWTKATLRPKFFDTSVAIERIKAEFGSPEAGNTLESMMSCQALVLDDLGAERETDFTKDQVSVVLRNRYNHILPTIITSNAANLGELGDQRIASRLSDGLVITLNGKDRRGKNP